MIVVVAVTSHGNDGALLPLRHLSSTVAVDQDLPADPTGSTPVDLSSDSTRGTTESTTQGTNQDTTQHTTLLDGGNTR